MSKKIAIIILISFIIVSSLISSFLRNTYKLKFEGNTSNRQEQVSEDNEPPVLELKYDKLILYLGDDLDYKALVLEAYDNKDGDVLSNVKHTEIDTSKLGIQDLEYSVKDNSGNETKKQIQVTILDKLPKYGE